MYRLKYKTVPVPPKATPVAPVAQVAQARKTPPKAVPVVPVANPNAVPVAKPNFAPVITAAVDAKVKAIEDKKAARSVTHVKRLTSEYRMVAKTPELNKNIKMDPNDIKKWYVRIVSDIGCESIFHIKHSPEYPFKPPVISCLTENGVFRPGDSICTSFSHYHENTWDTSMTIEKMYIGLISYYSDVESGKDRGIGVIQETPEKRLIYAKNSVEYNKTKLGNDISDMFYK